MNSPSRKRSRSRSPPPWHRTAKSPRQRYNSSKDQRNNGFSTDRASNEGRERNVFPREYARRNQDSENAQMQAWVSKEDEFVLKQSKKKAKIRVRDGRAKPIDWLVVVLTVADDEKDLLADEDDEGELDVVDPEIVIEEVPASDLHEMEREIDHYLVLEKDDTNCVYWKALKTVCRSRRQQVTPSQAGGRGLDSVSEDVEKLLGPKSLDQLRVLERQVNDKLQSNEPIDEEYWEQLLDNIKVYKAKAQLKEFYKVVVESRLRKLKRQQIEEAHALQQEMYSDKNGKAMDEGGARPHVEVNPDPMLKLSVVDKSLEVLDESAFLTKVGAARARVEKMGYVPMRQRGQDKQMAMHTLKPSQKEAATNSRFAASSGEDFSQATNALYNREAARGVNEDEEIFAGEEEVSTASKSQWANKYRPRKPRYFNRVQMGYEWNKYNQTHYDHDNPPPKVVQGYKFNVFYPDLIDTARAPTYRIEREHGRKKGQSFAPAGEEDTCLIRFMSGPPYEDVAFRIVDKEWDYSAKRERGFRSSFDKGILQLHFQFKKVYYRK